MERFNKDAREDIVKWLTFMMDNISDAHQLEALVLAPLYEIMSYSHRKNLHLAVTEDATVKLVGRLWLVDAFCMCRTALVNGMMGWIILSGRSHVSMFDVFSNLSASGTSDVDHAFYLLNRTLKRPVCSCGNVDCISNVAQRLGVSEAPVRIDRFVTQMQHKKSDRACGRSIEACLELARCDDAKSCLRGEMALLIPMA